MHVWLRILLSHEMRTSLLTRAVLAWCNLHENGQETITAFSGFGEAHRRLDLVNRREQSHWCIPLVGQMSAQISGMFGNLTFY